MIAHHDCSLLYEKWLFCLSISIFLKNLEVGTRISGHCLYLLDIRNSSSIQKQVGSLHWNYCVGDFTFTAVKFPDYAKIMLQCAAIMLHYAGIKQLTLLQICYYVDKRSQSYECVIKVFPANIFMVLTYMYPSFLAAWCASNCVSWFLCIFSWI